MGGEVTSWCPCWLRSLLLLIPADFVKGKKHADQSQPVNFMNLSRGSAFHLVIAEAPPAQTSFLCKILPPIHQLITIGKLILSPSGEGCSSRQCVSASVMRQKTRGCLPNHIPRRRRGIQTLLALVWISLQNLLCKNFSPTSCTNTAPTSSCVCLGKWVVSTRVLLTPQDVKDTQTNSAGRGDRLFHLPPPELLKSRNFQGQKGNMERRTLVLT